MKKKWKNLFKKCTVWALLLVLVVSNVSIPTHAEEANNNMTQGGPPTGGAGFPGGSGFPGGPGGSSAAADPIEGDILDIVLNVGATESEVQVTWYTKSDSAKIQVAKDGGAFTEYAAASKDSGYTAVYEIEAEVEVIDAETVSVPEVEEETTEEAEVAEETVEETAPQEEAEPVEETVEEIVPQEEAEVAEETVEEAAPQEEAEPVEEATENVEPQNEAEVAAEPADEEAQEETTTKEVVYYSHTVKLTGLETGSSYTYKVSGVNDDNEEIWSNEYTYTVKDTSEKLEFIVAGDPQIGSSSTESDAKGWAATMSLALANFPNASFLLSVGDQINSARNNDNKAEQNFMGFLAEDSQLTSLPIATSVGNHDNSHAQAYTSHFSLPDVSSYGSTSDEVTGEENYAFVRGNVLFMMLNTNSSSIAEHKEFIEKTIAAHEDCTWKVVAFHQSIYSVASHVNDGNIADLRNGLSPVFAENDIDVVLMGHDHVYARSYIMGGETGMAAAVETDAEGNALKEIVNPEGVQYITFNSASGSKFYNITQELYTYTAVQNQEKTPNYSHVSVDEDSFTVTTYRTSDNSVVDTVTLKKETTKTTAADLKTEGFYNEEAVLEMKKTAGYDSGIVNEEGGSAEIIQYNSDTQMYYVVNGTSGTLDIVPREVYTEDNQAEGTKFNLKEKLLLAKDNFAYGDMTSVAINTEKDLVAIAVQAAGTNDNGLIVLMDYEQNIKAIIDAGVQPDMVTFTEDGSKVLSANEGEPRDGYGEGTVDPMGTVTVADLDDELENIVVTNITFENWDAKREQLTETGVIIKKDTAPSVDFEPEYIAVNSNGTKAYVSLQEANAIATIDLVKNRVTSVKSLGFKDNSLEENALDVLKKDETANIQTEEYFGIYMPDGISIYEVNGTEYLVTANEGDSREWGDYCNEVEEKVGESKSKVVFFDTSDYDGVDADKKYLFGARSFSIYNAETMEQVYDSGSDFEMITAKVLPEYFNCSNDDKSIDDRSGKKGPEAESVVVGEMNGKVYAFIGLERIGGVMAYDVTDPANTKFVNYINSRDFSDDIAGDVSPEGLYFVAASESISGNAELLAAHEVSGTVAIYEITAKADDNQDQDTDTDAGNSGSDNSGDDQQNHINPDSTENNSSDSDSNESNSGSSSHSSNSSNTGSNSTSGISTASVSTGDTYNAALWSGILVSTAVLIGSLWLINRKKMKK